MINNLKKYHQLYGNLPSPAFLFMLLAISSMSEFKNKSILYKVAIPKVKNTT
jgi:hypothetical protein